MKRLMLIVCSLLLTAATALAAATASYRITTAPYRITLQDGRQILAKDRPVRSGSVLLYHPYPRGGVTSVPIEFIFGVNAALATSLNEAPTISVLNPGDVIILGPTGEGQPAPAPVTLAPPAPGSATIPGGVAAGAGHQGEGQQGESVTHVHRGILAKRYRILRRRAAAS